MAPLPGSEQGGADPASELTMLLTRAGLPALEEDRKILLALFEGARVNAALVHGVDGARDEESALRLQVAP